MKDIFGSDIDVEHKAHFEAPGPEDAAVDSGSEEGRDVLRRKPARAPTADDVRRHRAHHLPFRWSVWLHVPEIGRTEFDGRGDEDELEHPQMHWDYCFPRNAEGGEYVVELVGRDRHKDDGGSSGASQRSGQRVDLRPSLP